MDSEELLAKLRELEIAAAQKAWPLWAKVAVALLNRRIPNGTYGGVRGRLLK